jgi:ribose 5-phosphate isomerase B
MDKGSIGIACDHAGYELKENIKNHLTDLGIEFIDYGCFSDESVDYPDFAHQLAEGILANKVTKGISICGSGNGINIVMNKHQQLRSALCWTEEIASLAKAHNNANVCALPARFIDQDLAFRIIEAFLNTDFEGGRHERRINKIPVK